MHVGRFGFAVLAGFIGMSCSSAESAGGDESVGELTVSLQAEGAVVLESVSYVLETQAGSPVVDGTIPVPNDDSVISLSIQSLAAGSYELRFSAVAVYDHDRKTVACASPATAFTLAPRQELTLPTVGLRCFIGDEGWGPGAVNANVNVVVETLSVAGFVETLTYGPRSVRGVPTPDGSCEFPPVALSIQRLDPAIAYAWSAAPDGNFELDATNTSGTYWCESDGQKTLTVQATRGESSMTTLTVSCDAGLCEPWGPCGDGVVEGGEECDEPTPRCTSCVITPVCGDGITDLPEQCDDAGPSEACTQLCQLRDPCRECMQQDPDIASFQAAYCDPEPRCLAVENCVLDSGCYLPVPAACYCGFLDDFDTCALPEFVPDGPCTDEIVAGLEGVGGGNSELMDHYFDPNYPTGVAMLLVDAASNVCRDACFPPAPGGDCGDGIVDVGEECDAEGSSSWCDETCRLIRRGTPECLPACFETPQGADLAAFQAAYCDPSVNCLAVQECLFETGCLSLAAGECYCGENVDVGDCADLDFVPQGPCVDVIRAGAGFDNPDNWTVLERYFSLDYPTGIGMVLAMEVDNSCPGCF